MPTLENRGYATGKAKRRASRSTQTLPSKRPRGKGGDPPVDAMTDLLESAGASNPEVRPLPGSRRHDKCWPESEREANKSTGPTTAQLKSHGCWLEREVTVPTLEKRGEKGYG